MTPTPARLSPGAPELHIHTPEGVPITLEIGSAADRIAAFLMDLVLLMLVGFAVLIAAFLARSLWLIAFALSLSFVLRVFYFVWFEARARGATPGKRRMGLRVVRADGGPLSIEAVLARNFTRELEVFVPLVVLFAAQDFWPGHTGWARLGATGWILVIATMPMWNRSRARLGDLIAGTRVVRVPRAMLLSDLARRRTPTPGDAPSTTAETTFLPAQLRIYGIYELQVLEDVLRKARQPGGREAIAAVSKRIRTKIGWDPATQGAMADDVFLERFYAAQRRHLEQQLLFGKRKERKER
jgi:uncharacterized RDD family membrane protein YckC